MFEIIQRHISLVPLLHSPGFAFVAFESFRCNKCHKIVQLLSHRIEFYWRLALAAIQAVNISILARGKILSMKIKCFC